MAEMKHELQRWADRAMFGAEPMQRKADESVRPKVYLLEATIDPLGSIAAACKMYKGEVVRDKADIGIGERKTFWDEVGKTHLKAPLEFVQLHFLLEGVTRAFTHQLVRQRTAVYAQESLRFAVKEDMAGEAALPPSIQPESREHLIWENAIDAVDTAYHLLIDSGVPAEDARGLLPHATTTRVHYCTNLRNLLDHAGNRLCTQAQFEWRYVFAGIMKELRLRDELYKVGAHEADTDGWQWDVICDGAFRPVCYELGHCPFTASFDRDCVIRDRVQNGKFSEIHPAEWMMDPTAARRTYEDAS